MAVSPEEAKKLRQQLEEINKLYEKLGKQKISIDFNKAITSDIKVMANLLDEAKASAVDLEDGFGGIAQSIKNIIAEWKPGFVDPVKDATKSFKSLKGLAEKLSDDINGITVLNEKQLKQSVSQIASEQKRLELAKIALEKIKDRNEEQETLLNNLNSEYNVTNDLLKKTQERLNVEKQINKTLGLTGAAFKGISGILQKIGVDSEALNEINEKMKIAAKSGSQWKVLGAAIGGTFKALGKTLLDPAFILGTIIKLVKELTAIGLAFSQRTAEIARNFGISSSEAETLNRRFSDLTASSNNLLVNQKSLQEATTQINDRFGTSAMLTGKMLEDQIDLTTKLGLTGEEASKFAEYSLLTGKSQEKIVNSIGKQNKGILSNKKVIQEVAKIEGQLAAQYKNDPDLIAKAVVQTQKLGVTLKQAQDISHKLLDFESSISNELSAELITGMDLNLEKARYLALQGKSAEAAEELLKNLGPNGLQKFQGMNVIAQESLAAALGMSADQLADSLKTQQAISELSVKDKQAYQEAIKSAQEKGDYDRAAALEKQMNQGKEFELAKVNLDAQTKFNKAIERLKGLLASVVEGPLGKMADKITNMIAGIEKIPGIKEILRFGMPIAAVLTGGLLLRSLTKGTYINPTIIRDADSIGGIGKSQFAGGSFSAGKTLLAEGKLAKFGRFAGKASPYAMIGGLALDYGAEKAKEAGKEGLATGLSTAGGALSGAATGAMLGSIIPGVGTAIGAIAGGLIGGISSYMSSEPAMAEGGIVTKPTRALIGEAGPEAVIPLTQLIDPKNHVIAGTDLGKRQSQQTTQQVAYQDLSPLLEELKALRQEQAKANAKPTVIENNINSTKFGTALATNVYKVQ